MNILKAIFGSRNDRVIRRMRKTVEQINALEPGIVALNDAALQDSYKAMGAEKLITTMLTPGEFEDYSAKVLEVNGFQNVQELVDEAKN